MCDLLVVFSNQLGQGTHAALEQVVYEADRNLQLMLNDFIQTYVFIDEDEGKLLLFVLLESYSIHQNITLIM